MSFCPVACSTHFPITTLPQAPRFAIPKGTQQVGLPQLHLLGGFAQPSQRISGLLISNSSYSWWTSHSCSDCIISLPVCEVKSPSGQITVFQLCIHRPHVAASGSGSPTRVGSELFSSCANLPWFTWLAQDVSIGTSVKPRSADLQKCAKQQKSTENVQKIISQSPCFGNPLKALVKVRHHSV